MASLIFIDGNNLWHEARASRLGRDIGRQPLVVLVDRWAARCGLEVVMVFDGPTPPAGMAAQMQTGRVRSQFSGNVTADEVLVELIGRSPYRGRVRVVTSDKAILHEARAHRCPTTTSCRFMEEMLATTEATEPMPQPDAGKPQPGPNETDDDLLREILEDDDLPPYWQWG